MRSLGIAFGYLSTALARKMRLNFLVAGGAGFLGSNLCDRLSSQGDYVTCFDNLSTGSERNIRHLFTSPYFQFIPGNVAEYVPQGPWDGIYNFASPTAPGHYKRDPEGTYAANREGVKNLLDTTEKYGTKMLQTSTIRVTEELEPSSSPHAPYVDGKRSAEDMCLEYFKKGVDVKVARLFNTYGPKMGLDDSRVVPQFVMRALRGDPLLIVGEGVQKDSFCYVDDMLDGLVAYMNSDVKFGPIQFGYPIPISILDLAELTIKVCNSSSKIVFNGVDRSAKELAAKLMRPSPNISDAEFLLGWQPKVPLEDGIERLAKYYAGIM